MIGADAFEAAAFAGRPIDACRVIDAHGHLGVPPAFPLVDSSSASLVASMDRMGIAVACVSGIVAALGGQARRGNDGVGEAIRAFPSRIFGYAAVDIGYPERIGPELDRCMAAGFRGVKIHSAGGLPYDHPNYDAVFRFAEERALPLLAHTWGKAELALLERQFARCPSVRFILGHAGCMDRREYVRLALEHANVFLETCFSVAPRGLVEYLVSQGLADKVLWGSDATFIAAEHQIGRVLFARISVDDKRKILGANAARVLGLG